MAANNFTGATDSNWGTSTNWSLGSVPTANDGNVATFTNTSPNCTVNASARVCNAIDFTNYTGTITMSQQITVSGAVTLGASMNISGAGALICNTTATLTSNGKTWPNQLQFAGTSQTYTLADNWTVSGTVLLSGTTAITIQGQTSARTLQCNGSLTVTTATTSGSLLNITLGGTGTFSTAGTLTMNGTRTFEVNTSGSITLSGTILFRGGIFKYTTGTITQNAALSSTSSTTFACSGMTWGAVSLSGTSLTWTLTENFNMSGTLTLAGTTAQTLTGAFNWNVGGGVNVTVASNIVSTTGGSVIVMNGTGTLQTSGASSELHAALTINTAGTITFGTTVNYNTGAFTYTAGTINAGSSTWSTDAATTYTINNSGFSFNNLTMTANGTFVGTNGFTVGGTFKNVISTAANTQTFAASNTYTFNGNITLNGTANFGCTIKSNSAGTQANFVIGSGTQQCAYLTVTDINSSAGRTGFSHFGTLSNATNWVVLGTPATVTSGTVV